MIDMNRSGTLYGDFDKEGGYIDRELSMICHYKFPKTFLRRTKNTFLSFVSPNLIEMLISRQESFSYRAVTNALLRYDCLPRQTKGLRSFYATSLKKSLDREMIDLLQGRIDASVFVRNYYRPLLIQLRDKVLETTKPLEEEVLQFLH
jgi:intergrase/recombinase